MIKCIGEVVSKNRESTINIIEPEDLKGLFKTTQRLPSIISGDVVSFILNKNEIPKIDTDLINFKIIGESEKERVPEIMERFK